MFTYIYCFLAVAWLALPVAADTFLGGQWTPASSWEASDPRQQEALLSELEEELGTEHRHATEGFLARIKEVAGPTFDAMPKNEYGNVEHTAVRFTLHRFFVQRHGWFVRGVEPNGDSWNSSSPLGFLDSHVPQYVKGLFEKRLVGRGFDLHELAVLAAMLENLVQSEAKLRLQNVLESNEFLIGDDGAMTVDTMDKIIEVYLANYVTGRGFYGTPQGHELGYMQYVPLSSLHLVQEVYPNWPLATEFSRKVRAEVAGSQSSFDLRTLAKVIGEIADRFGRWQNRECLDLKHKLIAMQDRGSGCVNLNKFYSSGQWQFAESPEYLRNLGALDESNPSTPHVIVPNYVNGPSNCIATSQYYSLCCINECDDLFGSLERSLRAPDATPAELLALVSALPSDTVPANRKLSGILLQRLDEIALAHGGRVPLHGRLFTQWMHNAYPNECEFPHVSGTTRPRAPEAFTAETGHQFMVSDEVKQQYSMPSPRHESSESEIGGGECIPWDHVEELFVPMSVVHPQAQMEQDEGLLWTETGGVAVFCAISTMVVGIIRAWQAIVAARPAPPKLVEV